MKEEKTLNEKIVKIRINSDYNNYASNCFYLGDVEEFIKKLKEWKDQEDIIQIPEYDLDKLLGDKLI